MTTYAYDVEQHRLLAVWPTGLGHRTTSVAGDLSAAIDQTAVERLCAKLTELSEVLWDTYVHPASATDDEADREDADAERERLGEVTSALRSPNLPVDGKLLVSYSPVLESAHRAGRVLHELNDQDLTTAVAAAVEAEVGAIEQAELGDLSGRAGQATVLDRTDTSPAQVDAADAILEKDPLGSIDLFTSFDPVSACVAAAHWLTAAATVAAEQAEIEPSEVFEEAADIEPGSIEVPTAVVEAIAVDEESPRDVVVRMVREALMVKAGELPSLADLLAQTTAALAEAEQLPPQYNADALAHLPHRITPLDPQRPSRDLLEHLLDGIRASLSLFDEYVGFDDETGAPVIDQEPLAHPGGGDWEAPLSLGGTADESAYEEASRTAVRDEFLSQVWAEASSTHDRLG